MIKVGINGYGTIGKRVADAVSKQDDMKLVGVTKLTPDYEAISATEKNIDLYSAVPENAELFETADLKVEGSLNDLLELVDVVVDSTPKGIGMKNKEKFYEPKKLNAIFEGGEKADVADVSFVAQCNYKEALDKKYVRCVSCNTTGLSRTLGALNNEFKIGKVRVFLVRRSADPKDIKTGPINAIIPNPITVPSHHGSDVNTVLPDLNIISSAVKVPTTLMHLHSIMVELKEPVKEEQVIELFRKTLRVKLFSASKGFVSTAGIIEYARDLGRSRNDLYEIAVWEDSISVRDNELYYFQAIAQESNVVPENIDAIRAMFELEKDPVKSIEKTDKSLGII